MLLLEDGGFRQGFESFEKIFSTAVFDLGYRAESGSFAGVFPSASKARRSNPFSLARWA